MESSKNEGPTVIQVSLHQSLVTMACQCSAAAGAQKCRKCFILELSLSHPCRSSLLRYEGKLLEVDQGQGTVTLLEVCCFGGENLRPEAPKDTRFQVLHHVVALFLKPHNSHLCPHQMKVGGRGDKKYRQIQVRHFLMSLNFRHGGSSLSSLLHLCPPCRCWHGQFIMHPTVEFWIAQAVSTKVGKQVCSNPSQVFTKKLCSGAKTSRT